MNIFCTKKTPASLLLEVWKQLFSSPQILTRISLFLALFVGVFFIPSLVPHVQAQSAGPPQPTMTASSAAPAYSLPPQKLAKAIALSRIRNILSIVGSLWGLAAMGLLLATGAAAKLAAWVEQLLSRRWMQGLLFFIAVLVALTVASLPLGLIGHQVSRSYDISVQGWDGWFIDQAKALGLSLLFGAPILLLFNWIVRVFPRRFWLWIWLVSLPMMALSVLAQPLLAPLFDKFEPLSKNNSALVAELEKVVARTGTNIPPERMFLMKASEKTNGLNAYVSGMGTTKRIVVWDTTAGRIPNDEVLFIFGHESGHYVLNHIPKMLTASAVGSFFLLWGCAGFAGWLVSRFGVRWQVESFASRQGFMVLLFSLSLASFVLTPIGNAMSRHYEHEADVYGQEAIHGIVADPQKTTVSSFNHLGEAWLEDPTPNPFIEFWLYSHPSIARRANFAAQYDPWAKGGRGRFFDR